MALTCKLDHDMLRTSNCGYSLPEVTDIYLANFEDVHTEYASVESAGTNEITAINFVGDNKKFYHIEPAKGSASFEDALVVEDNGTKYRTHTLTFNVTGQYTKERSWDFDNLSLGKYFAVVKTAEGNYLGLGRITGLEAETATLAGGGDSNGLQVVLSQNVTESAYPLSDAAVDVVLGKN